MKKNITRFNVTRSQYATIKYKTLIELEKLGVIKIKLVKGQVVIKKTKFGQDVFNYMKKKGMI